MPDADVRARRDGDRVKLAALAVLAIAIPARADAPAGWLGRATPGFGYGWDSAKTCPFHGRLFDGGFAAAHDLAPGLFVGAAIALAFNARSDGACASRFQLGGVFGATLEWYPLLAHGAHVVATAGFAELDTDRDADQTRDRGVGGSLGLAWDWDLGHMRRSTWHGRLGGELQLSAMRVTDHRASAAALLVTFGFD